MTNSILENKINETVGYGRPPEASKFKKGTSGNPAGRPKGSKNTYTLLTKILDGKITLMEKGKRIKVTRKFAFLMRILNSALQGDIRSASLLFPHLILADAKDEEKNHRLSELSLNDGKLKRVW